MKYLKKAAALLLGLALTLSLVACGGGGAPAAQTPAEAVAAAQAKMAEIKSMDASVNMEMAMSMEDQSMAMNIEMAMTMFNDPEQVKIDMNMDMGELGSQQMSMYMAAQDGGYVLYMGDGTNWMTQAVAAEDAAQYDAQGSMDLYLDSTTDYKSAGTEQLDSGEADKYTGVIKGDSMGAVMEQSGALDSLASLIGDTGSMEELYKDLGDLPVTIWVDKASGYPARYEMDMTSFMSQLMTKAMEAAGAGDEAGALTVDKMLMVMTCSNFDSATPFTIPEEALAAAA